MKLVHHKAKGSPLLDNWKQPPKRESPAKTKARLDSYSPGHETGVLTRREAHLENFQKRDTLKAQPVARRIVLHEVASRLRGMHKWDH